MLLNRPLTTAKSASAMWSGELFAVHSAASCSVITTGEVRSVAQNGRVAYVFLRHTHRLVRFAYSNGGRTYYAAGGVYYFAPTSDSLPPKP